MKHLNIPILRTLLFGLVASASLMERAEAMAFSDEALCEEDGEVRIWISSMHPRALEPVNVKVVSTDKAVEELAVFRPNGERMPAEITARDGPT